MRSLLLLLILASPAYGQQMDVLYLDGRDAYVSLPPDLFSGLSETTIEAWVKWDKILKWSRIFDFGREGNAVVLQSEKSSRTLNFVIWDRDGRRRGLELRNAIPTGEWFHVAAVCGRSGMRLYLDGELAGSDGYTGGLEELSGGNYYIGRSNWPDDERFQGTIAEFRIWKGSRSEADIARYMDRTLTGREQGLVGYWRFDTQPEGDAPDLSGQGHSARLVAGAQTTTVVAIARHLIPGQLARDAASYRASGQANASEENWIGAFDYYRASLDLVPDDDLRVDMLEALKKGRVRATLIQSTASAGALLHPALEAAWVNLIWRSPPYVNWDNPRSLALAAPTQVTARDVGREYASAAAGLGVDLIVVVDLEPGEVTRSRPKHERRKALLLKTVPVPEDSTGRVLQVRPPKNAAYHRIRETASAISRGFYRVLDARSGAILDEDELIGEASDEVLYAEYKGDLHDLYIERRSQLKRAHDADNGFHARRALKTDDELIEEAMREWGRSLADRVLTTLSNRIP
jgi:hypothetical protein